MSPEAATGAFETGEGGLGEDGLTQGSEELAQQAPRAGAGQAAAAGRGESASAPTSGSSRRMISRWANT